MARSTSGVNKPVLRIDSNRARLISERNAAIAQLTELDPTYKPPAAFKFKNDKLEERVLIPAEVIISV